MRKKCWKRIFIGALVLLLSVASTDVVYAAMDVSSNTIETNESDEQQVRLVDVIGDTSGQSDLAPTYVYEIEEPVYTEDAIMTAEWLAADTTSYASDYIYRQLSDKEKILYDRLQKTCENYMNTTIDAVSITKNGETCYYTGLVDISDLNLEYTRAYYVALMFRYNNGQYYFLNQTIWRSRTDSTTNICKAIGVGIYNDYQNGEDRQAITAQFMNKVEEYQTLAAEQIGVLAKERAIHNKLCNEVDYIKNDYDQSAVSALLMGETVCAGYAQAFELICNSIGIETVGVTSLTHEWNKVLIDGHWYNVDATWGDKGSTLVTYDYFNKSDNYYAEYSSYCASSHTPCEYWEGVLPACNYDMDLNGNSSPNFGDSDDDDEYQQILRGWITGEDGKLRYYDNNGKMVTNQFVFDGIYTYYLQADGTPMTDRLTYHPDGEHIIYFDKNGHEVFERFQYCPSVGYTCYFDSNGYIYKDQITFYDNHVYYLNQDGRMEQSGWFRFANGRDYGYAESDGTLRANGFSYDPWGRVVFYHWNGMVARGLISDGVWYYSMDLTDGHYLGQFQVTN
jgi:hypothetical protein